MSLLFKVDRVLDNLEPSSNDFGVFSLAFQASKNFPCFNMTVLDLRHTRQLVDFFFLNRSGEYHSDSPLANGVILGESRLRSPL